MDAIERLRSRIPGFPGYSSEDDRRHSDGLVRSYFGEALALVRARLAPLDPSAEALADQLILRAGFMNQAVFKGFEYAVLDGAHVDAISTADNAMLDLADRAAGVDASSLDAFLAEAVDAFEARDRAMRS